MQRRILIQTTLVLGALPFVLFAADVAGKWVAQVPGRDGQTREQAITFAVDGDKLSGTMAGGPGPEAKIEDGKIEGDKLSFKVTREMGGNSVTWTYKGVIAGDEIKFTREGGRAPQEFVAKRAK